MLFGDNDDPLSIEIRPSIPFRADNPDPAPIYSNIASAGVVLPFCNSLCVSPIAQSDISTCWLESVYTAAVDETVLSDVFCVLLDGVLRYSSSE